MMISSNLDQTAGYSVLRFRCLHHYFTLRMPLPLPSHFFPLPFLIISTCLFLAQQPEWARASSFMRFLDHTQQRTTVGRTPLDKWPARRRDLYLTTHNTHNRQTSMAPGGIRTHNPSRPAAAGLHLRPRSHWDRQYSLHISIKYRSI